MLIRPLTTTDIPAAFAISCAAGWNQTETDWAMMIRLNPETCFGMECEGELAATAVLTCYGQRLAWVGMVLTAERFQRRGFARALLERVLLEADVRGIRTVKLDATEQGEPIYARLGFVAEQRVERCLGRGGGAGAELTGVPGDLDARAFGADRSALVRNLGSALVCEGGFVQRRAGVRARYLGPCVAEDVAAAGRLVRAALATDAGLWFWDVFAEHRDAVALASESGFAPVRRLMRMYRGKPLRGEESLVYGLAGFEFG